MTFLAALAAVALGFWRRGTWARLPAALRAWFERQRTRLVAWWRGDERFPHWAHLLWKSALALAIGVVSVLALGMGAALLLVAAL